MDRRLRRPAASRRRRWVLAGTIVVVVAALGAWGLAGSFASGGHAAQAARSREQRTSSGSTTTAPSASTTTTTTTTPLPAPTPVPIQGGSVAPIISRVPTPNPVVFFTIDDGLVRDPAVIDFLRDHHIPVTIFPIPAYVHQDPAYFDAIHSLGASAQDHTVTHPDLRKLAGAALQKEV